MTDFDQVLQLATRLDSLGVLRWLPAEHDIVPDAGGLSLGVAYLHEDRRGYWMAVVRRPTGRVYVAILFGVPAITVDGEGPNAETSLLLSVPTLDQAMRDLVEIMLERMTERLGSDQIRVEDDDQGEPGEVRVYDRHSGATCRARQLLVRLVSLATTTSGEPSIEAIWEQIRHAERKTLELELGEAIAAALRSVADALELGQLPASDVGQAIFIGDYSLGCPVSEATNESGGAVLAADAALKAAREVYLRANKATIVGR